MLLCSAGDFYGTPDEFNEPKSRFVARMMGRLGYDAVAVGEMDLNYGLSVLEEDAATLGDNVICANLTFRDSVLSDASTPRGRMGTVFPPYRIVERGGVRFGFVALLSPATKVRTAQRPSPDEPMEVTAMSYVIRDVREAAEVAIPEAAEQCDVLVLLAHMDRHELDALLPGFPEVDIAVIGHDPKSATIGQPQYVGTTMVLKATSQGQNIGHLEFGVDADGGVDDPVNVVHFLGDKYPDDPEVVELLDDFDVENRKLQKILYAKAQLRSSKNRGESNNYLGVATCQSCHVAQFDVYVGTAHARAYATLSSQFVHRDTNCVGCHVTGWQDEGGFSGARFRGDPVDLIDVQCEACHGPGAQHTRDGSYRERAIESCTRCHTPSDDPDFDFDKDWPKIAH